MRCLHRFRCHPLRRGAERGGAELLSPRVLWAAAACVAVLAVGLVLAAPRWQTPTGTLVLAVSGRAAGTLAQTPLQIHGASGWASLGSISGDVPAAPAERDAKQVTLRAGVYDGFRLGAAIQGVAISITAGQVQPVLLGIDPGGLIAGAVYIGNDDLNLGLGELSGKFVSMPAFGLEDQGGRPLNASTTAGKDLVIAAFHTTCHETCPLYTALFFQISKHLPAGVTLLEVTTDPGTDTPATLSRYASQIGATWTFATGGADALISFWNPFGVQLATGDSHVSTLALVDRHGYVRLVYRGIPDVGGSLPPQLIPGLSAQGLHELGAGGDGWGAPDVLRALLTIAGPQQPSPTAGGNAPAFTLAATDGVDVSLFRLAGKPVVVNFWATYCPPCRAEMPLLQRRAGPGSGVELLLIDEGDSRGAAFAFLRAIGIKQAALLDSDLKVGRSYGAVALPETVFIRADGTIEGKQIGQLDDRVLAAQVSLLVNH